MIHLFSEKISLKIQRRCVRSKKNKHNLKQECFYDNEAAAEFTMNSQLTNAYLSGIEQDSVIEDSIDNERAIQNN
jgi:hypothetical protein